MIQLVTVWVKMLIWNHLNHNIISNYVMIYKKLGIYG